MRGLLEQLEQLRDRRRLDERIVSLQDALPDADVLAVPGADGVVVDKQGSLGVQRQGRGPLALLSKLIGDDAGGDSGIEQIGSFSLTPMASAGESTNTGTPLEAASGRSTPRSL